MLTIPSPSDPSRPHSSQPDSPIQTIIIPYLLSNCLTEFRFYLGIQLAQLILSGETCRLSVAKNNTWILVLGLIVCLLGSGIALSVGTTIVAKNLDKDKTVDEREAHIGCYIRELFEDWGTVIMGGY